jgi:CRP-like cAMP-binding protein
LYRAGDPGESIYSIRDGLIKLVQYQRNGEERIVRLLKKGGVGGLEAFVSGSYNHTAIVVRCVNVCQIPMGIFSGLNSAKPRLYEILLQRWEQNLEMADLWICQFSTGPIEARVARLLLFLTEFGEFDHSVAIHLLNRQDMAGILGVTCESVCRVISHLRHSGIVRRSAPGLCDVSLDALRAIAGK